MDAEPDQAGTLEHMQHDPRPDLRRTDIHRRVFPVGGEQLHVSFANERVSFALQDGTPAPEQLVLTWAREYPADESNYFLLAACPSTTRARILDLIAAAINQQLGEVDIKAMRHAVCRWPRCDEAMLCRLAETGRDSLDADGARLLLNHPAAGVEILATVVLEMKRRATWPNSLVALGPDIIQQSNGTLGLAAIVLTQLFEDHHRDPAGLLAGQLAWLEDHPDAIELVVGLGSSWTDDRRSLLNAAGMLAA